MQNNLIIKISPTIRIILNLILILILLIAKSIFLILLLTILILILLILSDDNIKSYIDNLKKVVPWLIFFFLIYIIIYRNILGAFVFSYKIFLIFILVKIFISTINFNDLNSGIYTILSPINRLGLNISNISFDISLYIYYIIYLSESSNKIKKSQIINNKVKYSVKQFLLPRLIVSNRDMNDLENHLKINFYDIKKDKVDLKSKLLLISFIILFLVAIFKEVIL